MGVSQAWEISEKLRRINLASEQPEGVELTARRIDAAVVILMSGKKEEEKMHVYAVGCFLPRVYRTKREKTGKIRSKKLFVEHHKVTRVIASFTKAAHSSSIIVG